MKTIILAGGAGKRLWPVSTQENPKQFIKFGDALRSLLQETFARALKVSEPEEIFIVTSTKYEQRVFEEIRDLDINFNDSNIIGEPVAKNTLPAICAGILKIRPAPDEEIIVFPADHHIRRMDVFAESIKSSCHLAHDRIVTFGIKPSHPETGYGYIEPGERLDGGYCVDKFHEKPDAASAIEYVKRGCFWNAGIFMFSAGVFNREMKKHKPGLLAAFNRNTGLDEIYREIKKGVSIDKGLLEKTDSISVVPVDIGWSDLGNFEALHNVMGKDEKGNVVSGSCLLIESKDNVVHLQKSKKLILAGIEDVFIIEGDNALLICKKGYVDKVQTIIDNEYDKVE